MSRSQKVVHVSLAIVVIVNLSFVWLAYQQKEARGENPRRAMTKGAEHGEVLLKWHADNPLLLNSMECCNALAKLKPTDQLEVPLDAVPLSRNEIGEDLSQDLARTLHEFVCAYAEGTLSALCEYMESRGETVTPEAIDRLGNYLVEKRGYDYSSQLAKMSDTELVQEFWDVMDIAPGWEYLIANDCGLQIWQSANQTSASLSDPLLLGTHDATLWMRQANVHHNFGNADGDNLEQELARSGRITVADARIVIKHKGGGIHSICPYVIRFWYSTHRRRWIPHLLLQFRTSLDIPRQLIF